MLADLMQHQQMFRLLALVPVRPNTTGRQKSNNPNLILINFSMKIQFKKFIRFSCLTIVGGILLASCHLSNKSEKLKFDPVLNKAYYFSLTKYSLKSWTYQSIPAKIYDTVYLNFSLQNIYKTDTSATCRLTLDGFIWKGKHKMNYQRDSLHALSVSVVLSDSGKVKSVGDMDDILRDIENDSATRKFGSVLIPDQVSESAITDMLNRIFSVIPAKAVKPQDTWVTNITLNTNHPVNCSNFNVLKGYHGDTAIIGVQSNVFARLSPGAELYIKGNQSGEASINYQTGIPYYYKTESEIVTTTNYYDIKEDEKFILIEREK